jgi:opacity protein-like surface antigen
MKKLLFIAVIAILSSLNVSAQETPSSTKETSYGVTAGFQSTNFKFSLKNLIENEVDAEGFFIGLFAEFPLSEKFSIQPEFHYSSVTEDGESVDNLILPVFLKYYITEKFNVMSGLQFDYFTEKDLGNIKRFGLGLGIGLGVDITDSILISSRYSFGIINRIDTSEFIDDFIDLSDLSAKTNIFQIGLGYRF